MPKLDKKVVLEPKGRTLPELAKELAVAIAKKKKLDEQSEALGSLIHKLAVIKLPPLLEDLEADVVSVPGVGKLAYSIEIYPHVKVEDIPKFYLWLRANKVDIIKETIHPKTLQAFVKEQLTDAKTLPDYVNVAKVPTVKLKK